MKISSSDFRVRPRKKVNLAKWPTKRNTRLIVSQIVVDTLSSLEMTYPKLDGKRRFELQQIRDQLAGETS